MKEKRFVYALDATATQRFQISMLLREILDGFSWGSFDMRISVNALWQSIPVATSFLQQSSDGLLLFPLKLRKTSNPHGTVNLAAQPSIFLLGLGKGSPDGALLLPASAGVPANTPIKHNRTKKILFWKIAILLKTQSRKRLWLVMLWSNSRIPHAN